MKELLQKIILKAYEVNEKTEHTVFIHFYGHINSFEIEINLNEWYPNKEKEIRLKTYLNEKTVIENLENMLKKIEELEG